jgi:excisionase family DNA binding protein
MDYTYEANITREDGDWLISFPAFPGSFGGGRTMRKACRDAAEALRMAIAQTISDGGKLPKATFHTPPKAVFTVQVDGAYAGESGSVTATEAARMLGVSKGRVSQLVTAGQLDTVLVGGRSRITLASIDARKRS